MKAKTLLLSLSMVCAILSSCAIGPNQPSGSSEESTVSSSSFESSVSSASSSASSASSTSREAIDARWKVDTSTYGVTFRDTLASLIKATGSRTVAYSTNNTILAESDAAPGYSNQIQPFYRAPGEHVASGNWNKEHVWPNSRGAGKTGIGSDPHMLRPTYTNDNSSRGNSFFGLNGSTEWDPASFGYEPARGEAARICFYVATRYYDTCGTGGSSSGTTPVSLSNQPSDSTSKHTMGTLKYLVQWNNQYPVTDEEKRRNDALEELGFGRNPFIDSPDLANYIWSTSGIRESAYLGGALQYSANAVLADYQGGAFTYDLPTA